MGSDSNVIVLADDIDILVSPTREDIDLRIADEKVLNDAAHCELHYGHCCSATHGALRFIQPMTYGGLCEFRLTQHEHRVTMEFLAGIRHSELPRRAIEQPDTEIRLKLLDAVAQCRFWNSQGAAGRGKPAALNHLNKIEEIVEIQHCDRPSDWTLSRDFCVFWIDSPSLSLGKSLSFQRENIMSEQAPASEPLASENAALILVRPRASHTTGVRDCSTGEFKHSGVGPAKAAKALERSVRKRAQEELRLAQVELADMTHAPTMGELAASIAHEINQPLAAIITTGETILRWLARPTPDAEKIRQLTKNMVADARRASKIIDLIRATVSGRKPQAVWLSLENVVEESITFLKHEFQSRDISVSLDLAKELPQIVGDRTQLQQVIVNLAVNAVQATAKSDDRIILVRTMLSGPETVCCVVEDSGAGVDSAHLPHLFDGFFTTKVAGMGMGLSISRSIIEAHGGRIRVANNSRLGGARFSFDLPTNGAV